MHAARVIYGRTQHNFVSLHLRPPLDTRSTHRNVHRRSSKGQAIPVRVRHCHRVLVHCPDLCRVVGAVLDEQRLRRRARHHPARGHTPVTPCNLARYAGAEDGEEGGDVVEGAVAGQGRGEPCAVEAAFRGEYEGGVCGECFVRASFMMREA